MATHCRHHERFGAEFTQAENRAAHQAHPVGEAPTAAPNGHGHAGRHASGERRQNCLTCRLARIGDGLGLDDRKFHLDESRDLQGGVEGEVNAPGQLLPWVRAIFHSPMLARIGHRAAQRVR